MLPLKIVSTGKALPSRCVTSEHLDTRLGRSVGFVQSLSGVRYRYHATDDETQSGLAAAALHDALALGDIDASSIDLVISAAAVPEQALPNTASHILAHAGLRPGTPGFDVNASCLGFLAALQTAAALLGSRAYRRIAVVASDLASRGLDFSSPESSLILGDGAAAVIVEAGDGRAGIEGFRLETWPEGRALCEIRAGGSRRTPERGAEPSDFRFRMDGRGVFRLGSKVIEPFVDRLFATAGCRPDDVAVVVPHQASHLAMQHIRKRLRLPEDRVVDIYSTHGNQVAASLPTALHEARQDGRLRDGSRALLIGTAAGFSIGAMVLRT